MIKICKIKIIEAQIIFVIMRPKKKEVMCLKIGFYSPFWQQVFFMG